MTKPSHSWHIGTSSNRHIDLASDFWKICGEKICIVLCRIGSKALAGIALRSLRAAFAAFAREESFLKKNSFSLREKSRFYFTQSAQIIFAKTAKGIIHGLCMKYFFTQSVCRFFLPQIPGKLRITGSGVALFQLRITILVDMMTIPCRSALTSDLWKTCTVLLYCVGFYYIFFCLDLTFRAKKLSFKNFVILLA